MVNQLWIAGRFTDAVSLLVAPVFLTRRLPRAVATSVYANMATILFSSIAVLGVFPVCLVPGQGLTSFKVANEYVIYLMLIAAIAHLRQQRQNVDDSARRPMMLAVARGGRNSRVGQTLSHSLRPTKRKVSSNPPASVIPRA